MKVAVTEPEFHKAEEVFSRAAEYGCECLCAPAQETSLAKVIRSEGIRAAIIGVEKYAGPLYQALGQGGVIARFGVGHDGVDKEQACSNGALCTNTPGVLDDSVAEHTISLMLAAARGLTSQAAGLRAGAWSPQRGTEVRGKKLAIIGCGAIGCRVARIAARGLGLEVIGCRRKVTPHGRLASEFGFSRLVDDFQEAVQDADFVSLHLPSLPETRHFLNGDRLRQLAAHSQVINTARGALVDEVALFDALVQGQLQGAALDVFEREPYEPAQSGKDLRTLPRVIMTPHISSSTREACVRMARRALENIRLAGEARYAEMDLLNPQVIPKLLKT